MNKEPNPSALKISLPVAGDYSKPAQLMNPADKSLFLRQQTDRFILKARQYMTPKEITNLPTDTAGYINAMVSKALDHVDTFHSDLADMVVARYNLTPTGGRFIYDPVNKGSLFTDANGELVTLMGAEISTTPKGVQGEGRQNILKYDKAFVWTGPEAGKEFTPQEKPIPVPTTPKPELLTGRQERTKITPRMKVDMFFQKVRAKLAEAGHPISPPGDTAGFVDAHVKATLENIDLFKDVLSETIAFLYHYRPTAERFIRDPNTEGTLFVDKDQNIVVLSNAHIERTQKDIKGIQYNASYDTATVLSGPDKGKTFTPKERPLPSPVKPHQYQVISSSVNNIKT